MPNPCHSLVVYRGASLIFTNMLVVIISDIALYDSRCGNAGSRLRRDKRGDWMKNEGGKGSDGRACSIMSHSTRVDQLLDPHLHLPQPCVVAIHVLQPHPSVTPSHTHLQPLDHCLIQVARLDPYYLDTARRCPKSRNHRFDSGGPKTVAFL